MAYTDSIDKVVQSYFSSVTEESFTYKGVEYAPKPLTVSPLLLRGFTCPEGCGGCCPRFSLDYLPTEFRPVGTVPREVQFNGKSVLVHSDIQSDHKDHFCRNLNKENGRCKIYTVRPFSCDFELIRFFVSQDSSRLSQQLFGRGWAFLTIQDTRGALCDMTPVDEATTVESVRKLLRLQQWADHFGIKTKVPKILEWIVSGQATKALKIS